VVIPVTGYRSIAEALQDAIATGVYRPGQRIPSYTQLCATYGVGLTTVQRAIMVLRERGLVVGVPGRGVYVAEPRPRRRSSRSTG